MEIERGFGDEENFEQIAIEPQSERAMRMRRRLQWESSPREDQHGVVTLQEARQITIEAIDRYIAHSEPDEILIVATPPGGGKTSAMIRAVQRYEHRTIVAMPNKDHFMTIAQSTNFSHSSWYQWRATGDDSEEVDGVGMCMMREAADELMKKRWPLNLVCRGICGEYKAHCEYQRQKKTEKRIIATSHHFLISPFSLRGEQPRLLVVDEDPSGIFQDVMIIKPHNFPTDGSDELIALMRELTMICVNPKRLSGRELMKKIEPLATAFLATVADDPLPEPTIESDDDIKSAPLNFLHNFIPIIKMELSAYLESPERYAERLTCGGGEMVILSRSYLSESVPLKIIILDGTADLERYKAIFPDKKITFVQPRVQPLGPVYQITANQLGTGAVDQKTDYLLNAVDELVKRNRYKNVGVVTYKKLVPLFEALIGAGKVLYFGGDGAGSNALGDCDAVFVIGTYQPPAETVKSLHLCINSRDMRYPKAIESPAGIIPLYTEKLVFYRSWDKNGHQASRYVGGFWLDPLYTTWRWACHRPMIQAAGRSRYLYRHDVDTWIFSSLPLEIDLTAIYDDAPIGPQGIAYNSWVKIRDGISSAPNDLFITNSVISSWAEVADTYTSHEKWLAKIATFLGTTITSTKTDRRKKGFFIPIYEIGRQNA